VLAEWNATHADHPFAGGDEMSFNNAYRQAKATRKELGLPPIGSDHS
jgi:hypothetical protein